MNFSISKMIYWVFALKISMSRKVHTQLGKLHNLTLSQFPCWQNGGNNMYLKGLHKDSSGKCYVKGYINK